MWREYRGRLDGLLSYNTPEALRDVSTVLWNPEGSGTTLILLVLINH